MDISLETLLANPDSAAFWREVQEDRFTLQRCSTCGSHRFYPRAVCPKCLGASFTWEPIAGTGEIYAETVVRRAPAGFDLSPPYQVALVTLDEGVRVLATIRPGARVRIGDRVRLGFRTTASGLRMPELEQAT